MMLAYVCTAVPLHARVARKLPKHEVLRIANAAVQRAHYRLQDYAPPEVCFEYMGDKNTWTVFYRYRVNPLAVDRDFHIDVDNRTRSAKLYDTQ